MHVELITKRGCILRASLL